MRHSESQSGKTHGAWRDTVPHSPAADPPGNQPENRVTGSKLIECPDGTREWRRHGEPHRDGDLPAVEDAHGSRWWYRDGKTHRDGDKPAVEWANGNREWYRNGKLHREDDRPAVELADGTREWWRDGRPHREGDMPAVEEAEGLRVWYRNGKRHRDGDKPAIERPDGLRLWYRNDLRHRDGDLPAIERPDGSRVWWTNGQRIREEYPGWTAIYQDEERGYTLHRSPDGQYRAGCRLFLDAETAAAHWGAPDYPDPERGKQYVAAIKASEDSDRDATYGN